jgi:hypothetical protein
VSADPGGEETVFRSLAAPGLEEDDLFLALQGLPVPSPFWGEGWPDRTRRLPGPWDEAAERRRRHEELLAKWREHPPEPGALRPSVSPARRPPARP